jgi:hypothetical protein
MSRGHGGRATETGALGCGWQRQRTEAIGSDTGENRRAHGECDLLLVVWWGLGHGGPVPSFFPQGCARLAT